MTRSARTRGRLFAVGAAFIGLLTVGSASGLAAGGGIPPQHFSDTIVTDGGGFDCSPYGGNFDQSWHIVEQLSRVTTFDASGNPIGAVTHVGWSETDTRSDTGATLDVHGDWTVKIDYIAGTKSVSGAYRIGTSRSLGLLIQDAGGLVFMPDGVSISGPHEVFKDPDGSFCRALAALGS